MNRFCVSLLSILISVIAFSASLDETALSILRGSSSFRSGSLSLLSLEETLKTDGNLPDPQFEGEFLAAPKGETDRWGAELSWSLEWPGVYSERKKESDLRLLAAKERLNYDRAEKLGNIKSLLLDFIFCSKKLDVINGLQQSNDSIFHYAEVSAKNGQITVLDLNKIRLEKANVTAAKAGVLNERAEIINSLTEIYGDDCSNLLAGLNCEFPEIYIPSETEMDMISKNSPDFKSALAESEAARRGKKLALMEALPNISFGYKHAFEDGVHFNGATLGISLPLFSSHNKQKAAQAIILENEFNIEASASAASAEANALLNQLKLMKDQIDSIQPVLLNTDHSALLIKAYEEGLISMIDYLTERNYFTSAHLELLSLRLSAAKAQISLLKFIDPQNYQIN